MKAQQFGGNNSSIHWKQIKSKPARVIFPDGADSIAKRILDIIDHLDSTTLKSIGIKKRKINVVLHDQTTISNAYVGLGPFRSEFYLTPVQNSFEQGSTPWPDQLASHEYRHVQQYSNFNVGLSKILGILFGQEGQALANDGAIPNWFFEGDAVYNETTLSSQGRGRLPYFFKDYKALWQAKKTYSWMKLRNGSYKEFIPDHYALGYLLVAYGYQKYGDTFWMNVTQNAAAYKGLFYPFQRAIEKYSGIKFYQFRENAINYFKNELDSQNNENIKIQHQTFKSEEYPFKTNDSTVIFVSSSYKKIPAFVISVNGKERKIRNKDISLDNYFSYKKGFIVYAAYQPDNRWGFKDFSDLKLLNVSTGDERSLTKHTKYFSPDLNDSCTLIIAVNVTQGSKNNLELLNVKDGNSIKKLPNVHQFFYTYPKFVNDSVVIAAVRNNEGKMAFSLFNIKTNNEELLTPFTFNVIGFPCIHLDTLYFSSSYKRNDKLMAFNLRERKLFELIPKQSINSNGYYQPSADDHNLIWTTFTYKGFKIKESVKNNINWLPVSAADYSNGTSDFGATAVNNKKYLFNIPHHEYTVEPYKKTSHILNFHSIEPDINDPVYSIHILSENILNTLQSQVSLSYDRNEGYKKGGVSFNYAGLYPYLSAGMSYTVDRSALLRNKIIYWNETETFGGLNLPLNLSHGRSLTFMNIGTQYTYNHSAFQGGIKPQNISYSYLNNFFSISNQVQQARQNIYPRFAQSLTIKYLNTLTQYEGRQFTANANLYLPGILTNHSIILNSAVLLKDTLRQISFSSGFPFSRGYSAFNFHQMFKYGINYHLPLIYPDAGIANIVYFLRIRSNLFYDHTQVMDYRNNHTAYHLSFRSLGAELFFDTKWWNQSPITFGIRYSHLLDQDLIYSRGERVEFILPLNIFHN